MNDSDLSTLPGAFQAAKLPIPLQVEFAGHAGVLASREGPVHYQAGDALLTGVEGERWPVARQRFDDTYAALPPTAAGAAGTYVKRRLVVWAWPIAQPVDIALSGGRGTLHGAVGDVLVQYGPGDVGVVAAAIFQKTYRAV